MGSGVNKFKRPGENAKKRNEMKGEKKTKQKQEA